MDFYFPRRFIIVIMTSLGMIVIHAMRVNIAVTAITFLDKKPHTKVGTAEAVFNLPSVNWSSQMVGYLHSIFYTGYLFTQIPGGILAQMFPAHRIFGGCILVSCTLNLLLPICIEQVGYGMAAAVRALQGLSEGLLFPSSYAIMRHWVTPEEKSRMGSVVLTGVYSGAVIGLPISGFITHYLGWNYVYYFHGGIGIFWFIIWLFLGFEKPSHHRFISQDEIKHIEASQGQTAIVHEDDQVPWKQIFLSLPVNALNLCNFARSFIFFLLLTNEPEYLNVFGFTIAENGLYSAMPHLFMAIFSGLSGPMADYLINGGMVTPTQVRKLFTGIGFGMEGTCMLLLVFIRDGTLALIYLTIGVGFSGFSISGWQINHLDLSPRYASVLVGITTAVGTVAGILNPTLVGQMTKDQVNFFIPNRKKLPLIVSVRASFYFLIVCCTGTTSTLNEKIGNLISLRCNLYN
ncbi:DgyrCDS916 [Dimorphilus gyrociliatus]|uniref:DgyrCDS916 n=2 Tax=Dimorphilus gyrociliatus TaxID=2664684 RepID=A0A7I8V782_9ANNE|nr:DgyrCDS916 [Dimorphilus gyrociliatus]